MNNSDDIVSILEDFWPRNKAIENGWHGNPPARISKSGISVDFISLMSLIGIP